MGPFVSIRCRRCNFFVNMQIWTRRTWTFNTKFVEIVFKKYIFWGIYSLKWMIRTINFEKKILTVHFFPRTCKSIQETHVLSLRKFSKRVFLKMQLLKSTWPKWMYWIIRYEKTKRCHFFSNLEIRTRNTQTFCYKISEKSYSKNKNIGVSISQINDWAHSFR